MNRHVKCKSALTFYSCVQYLQLSKMVILDERVMVVNKIENVAPVISRNRVRLRL